MKRFLLFSVLFCFVSALSIHAANRDLVLVDANGKEIKDNVTLNLNKVTDNVFGPQINSGLFVRNTSGKDVNFMVVADIQEMKGENAYLKMCFPSACNIFDKKMKYESQSRNFLAKEKDASLETEFFISKNGSCVVVLKFYTTKSPAKAEKAVPLRLITTVKLKFSGDVMGVDNVENALPNTVNEVWTAQGVFVGRNILDLNSLPKGLYVVKQNGKATKVVVGQ